MTIRHRQPSLKTDPVSNEKKAERRKTITECETFKATCTKAPCVSTLREDFVAAGRKSTWLLPLVSVPIFGCILYLLLHYLWVFFWWMLWCSKSLGCFWTLTNEFIIIYLENAHICLAVNKEVLRMYRWSTIIRWLPHRWVFNSEQSRISLGFWRKQCK